MRRIHIAAAAFLACVASSPLTATDYYYAYHYPAGTTVGTNTGYAVHYFHDQATIRTIQHRLLAFGYTVPADGVLDPYTIDAVKHVQQLNGLAVTGAVDHPTMAALGLKRGMRGVGPTPVVVPGGTP